jgi:hypothetical protein
MIASVKPRAQHRDPQPGNMLPVTSDDLSDRHVGHTAHRCKLAPIGQPFADNAIVLLTAGVGAVRPQVDVRPVEGDDGLAGCTVLAIRRILIDETGRERTSKKAQNGKMPFYEGLSGRSAPRGTGTLLQRSA